MPRFKSVMRYDNSSRLFRLFRIMWECGLPGTGNGYSAKLSVALTPRIFRFKSEWDGWLLTVLGLRVHMQRSWGGIFA